MVEQPLNLEAFWRNIGTALRHNSPEVVLTALSMKLIELGTFNLGNLAYVHQANTNLGTAVDKAQTVQERDTALSKLSRRIHAFANCLPPEYEECAFLADQAQVKELLEEAAGLLAETADEEPKLAVEFSLDAMILQGERRHGRVVDNSPMSDDFLQSVYGFNATTHIMNPAPAASPEKPSRESILLEDKEF